MPALPAQTATEAKVMADALIATTKVSALNTENEKRRLRNNWKKASIFSHANIPR
jgi:hypothetical protein